MVSPSETPTTLPMISAEKRERERKSKESKNSGFMLWYFPLELWKTPQKKRCIPVCTSQHAYHGVPTNAKQKCTVYAQYTAQKRIVGKALFFCGNLLREPFYAIYDFSFQVFFSSFFRLSCWLK